MKRGGRIQLESVGVKIFIVVFAAVVIVSAVLGISSYLMSKQIIRGQVGLASSQAIEQAADKLDFLFAEYEAISRQLAVDQVLRTDLETVTNQNVDIVRKTEAETRIRNKLDAMRGSDERLVGIRLISPGDFSNTYASSGASPPSNEDAVQTKIKAIQDAQGKPLWIPGQKQGFFETFAKPSVTMGRVLQNLKHPEAEYILLIEIKDEALRHTLSNLKMGRSGEVRILTADNVIVHAADPELIETTSDIGLDERQLQIGEASFTMEDANGVKQLVVYRQLQSVDWRIVGYAPESDFLSAADKLIWVTVFVLCFAVLVALAIGYYLFRMVGKPLMKLCRLMEEGERGNLRVRTNFKSRGEIGQQMDYVMSLNASMDASAGRVSEVSRKGREYMDNLVEKTESVTRMTGLIEENSAKLSRSTHSIRSILAPMVEMTKQTNILSLNASIEASRAGVAGKGFVVIAEEIRKLTAESNEAVQTVSAMTEEIQTAIEDTVNVLIQVTPMFGEQLLSVKEASSIFQNVAQEMERFVTDIQSSSASVHELRSSQQVLSEFIASVSSVVQQTTASTEEVASMSSEQFKISEELVKLANRLEGLSETLKQSLSSFQIDSDGAV
ncbi:methyl-accepting chemotaxis protein [Paenibacillus woosongensis]|uniref:Methyl-accepting chemotaxis protein n=1 Tax=Paenibacillus woosongensis TaxID=307580 RepID=A0AA95IBK9_9BACL|nr:methyl-accepting chemotaxis protein [Paenibacillus woosongensis]WHX49655.1 methyl-accepting chemotaxis protein [Paenibacillus woosongensis]